MEAIEIGGPAKFLITCEDRVDGRLIVLQNLTQDVQGTSPDCFLVWKPSKLEVQPNSLSRARIVLTDGSSYFTTLRKMSKARLPTASWYGSHRNWRSSQIPYHVRGSC